ncbi:MAG: hypothetical protein IPI35_30405 [Deltaproteobacteria bacterium]|nr:hypothetical protein [Deltaproteobacteria bacterium]
MIESVLGTCTYVSDGIQVRTTVEGDDPSKCGSQRFGCETFARGVWTPAANCDGGDEIVVLEDPFPLPERVCIDPLPGEPEGQSEDGQVCTWQVVSGATEEGRHFSDYAECDIIRRQRPYGAAPANARANEEDPRMDDPAYVAEVDWVRDQLRAGSCDCCHSSAAPNGPAIFDAEFEGNLLNQFNDRGLAMAAGWIPTIGFGTYPPEENNGFERSSPEDPYLSIIPTTDQARMMAIFEDEPSTVAAPSKSLWMMSTARAPWMSSSTTSPSSAPRPRASTRTASSAGPRAGRVTSTSWRKAHSPPRCRRTSTPPRARSGA